MCGKHITIGAVVIAASAIIAYFIIIVIQPFTDNSATFLIPTLLLLGGLTILGFNIFKYLGKPLSHLIKRIIAKGSLRTSSLIIVISLLAMVILAFFSELIVEKIHNLPPRDEIIHPLRIIFWYILEGLPAIVSLLLLILLGVFLVHLGFPQERRKRNFLLLLRCTFYFSLLGVPFLYFKMPIGIPVHNSHSQFCLFFAILTPLTGLVQFILQWLRYIGGAYTTSFSGIVNFFYFLFVFVIHVRIIAIIYGVSYKQSLVKLLTANMLLAVIYILISISPIKTFYHQFIWLKVFVYQILPDLGSLIMP